MTKRVLFVDSCPVYLGRRKCRLKPYPLLGMTYVATCTRKSGYDVRIMDKMMNLSTGQSLRNELQTFHPDIVAFTSTIPFVNATLQDMRATKLALPNVVTVLGGSGPTAVKEQIFEKTSDADYLVIGEGEISFIELLEALDNGSDGVSIPGVINYNSSGNRFQERALITDLDSLPIPDWSLYPIKYYGKVYSLYLKRRVRSLPIQFSRGCPFDCTFCSSIFHRSYRTRTPRNLVREMKRVYMTFGIRAFDFVDAIATANKEQYSNLCEEIIASTINGKATYTIETRADLIDEEMINLSKKAGCESILFGLESWDQTVLNKLNKEISTDDYLQAFELTKKAGIHVKCTLIIGTPYDTRETLRRTMDFLIMASNKYNIEFIPGFLAVYPGTRMYELIDKEVNGVRWKPNVKKDWAKARREEPMIEIPGLSDAYLKNCFSTMNRIRLKVLERIYGNKEMLLQNR